MKLRSRDTKTISWQGQTFMADANGMFEVPVEAAEDLKSHGLEPASVEVEPVVPTVKTKVRK